jgi:hypothetical protein
MPSGRLGAVAGYARKYSTRIAHFDDRTVRGQCEDAYLLSVTPSARCRPFRRSIEERRALRHVIAIHGEQSHAHPAHRELT